MSALFEARTKWYVIGIELKLSLGTLNIIREDFPRAPDCLREMCIDWLKRIDPSPSWEALDKALESSVVEEGHLAQQLRDNYCQVRKDITSHVDPTPRLSPLGASFTSQGMYSHTLVIGIGDM